MSKKTCMPDKQNWLISLRAALIIMLSYVFLLVFVPLLGNLAERGKTDKSVAEDSVNIQLQNTESRLLNEYRQQKLQKRVRWYQLDRILPQYNRKFYKSINHIVESDLFQASRELYIKYYLNKIELFNFNSTFFIYLDFKEAQNNLGALQFKVALPDFNRIFYRQPRPGKH